MRKIAAVLVVVLVGALAGYAQTCTQTTLNNYLGNNFQCSIQDQTYSSWNYTSESTPSGFAPPASGVTVTPIDTPQNPGFQFTAGWYASTSSGVLSMDSTFEWTAMSQSPITDLSLSIAGVGFSGTGSINLDETACLGAVLPACSGGTIVQLSVFDNSTGSQLFDEVNFAGVNEVSVEKDLLITAGTNGSAEVSVITDQFSEGSSTVPEPGTLGMMGAGIVAIAGFARRKFNL
ncbi:MAG: PEP-CTERM sorting domain-containing protein [Candidatus Korobacteraceae bacterium]